MYDLWRADNEKNKNEIIEKYRYGEHSNCGKCIAKEGCKMNPNSYGCALTKDGEWIGFIK